MLNSQMALMRLIDRLNEAIGRATAWVALILVLMQFAVVLLRYVFGVGFIFMQESIFYLHSFVFMVGAGYTLLHDGHVRIDIFYRAASARWQAQVNLVGVLVLLLPACAVIWWSSWPYVCQSWKVLEGSSETSGIQALFLLKSLILVFVILIALQGISLALRSALVLAGREEPKNSESLAKEAPSCS